MSNIWSSLFGGGKTKHSSRTNTASASGRGRGGGSGGAGAGARRRRRKSDMDEPLLAASSRSGVPRRRERARSRHDSRTSSRDSSTGGSRRAYRGSQWWRDRPDHRDPGSSTRIASSIPATAFTGSTTSAIGSTAESTESTSQGCLSENSLRQYITCRVFQHGYDYVSAFPPTVTNPPSSPSWSTKEWRKRTFTAVTSKQKRQRKERQHREQEEFPLCNVAAIKYPPKIVQESLVQDKVDFWNSTRFLQSLAPEFSIGIVIGSYDENKKENHLDLLDGSPRLSYASQTSSQTSSQEDGDEIQVRKRKKGGKAYTSETRQKTRNTDDTSMLIIEAYNSLTPFPTTVICKRPQWMSLKDSVGSIQKVISQCSCHTVEDVYFSRPNKKDSETFIDMSQVTFFTENQSDKKKSRRRDSLSTQVVKPKWAHGFGNSGFDVLVTDELHEIRKTNDGVGVGRFQ
eukprot:g258.t1